MEGSAEEWQDPDAVGTSDLPEHHRLAVPARAQDDGPPVRVLLARLEERQALGRRLSWEPFAPDPDVPDDLALLLRRASAALDRRIERRLAGSGADLTILEVETLRRLRRHASAGVSLAEYLDRSPQRMSRVLAGLVDKGLVEREVSWRDGRRLTGRLTDHGLDVMEELDERLTRLLAGDLEGVHPSGRRILALLLAMITDG